MTKIDFSNSIFLSLIMVYMIYFLTIWEKSFRFKEDHHRHESPSIQKERDFFFSGVIYMATDVTAYQVP